MEKVELSDSERAVVEDINDFLGDDINNARALELIASVWYLLPEGRLSNEISSRVVDELQKCKPEFKREELESTVEKIISFRKKKRGTK